MTRYYLGPWAWLREPIPCWGPPAGASAGLELGKAEDLASPAGSPRAMGLFLADGPLPSEYVPLADDALSRSAWASLTGRAPDGDTVAAWLWDHLTAGADPAGESSCKPLAPSTRGGLELHLAGPIRSERFRWGRHGHTNRLRDLLRRDFADHWGRDRDQARRVLDFWCERHRVDDWREFVPASLLAHVPGRLQHQTAYTDDFNRADGSPGANWAEKGAGETWDISSNQLRLATPGGTSVLVYNGDLSSVDHYTEFTFVSSSSTLDAGLCTRHDNATYSTAHFYLFSAQGFATRTALYRFSLDNYTQIGGTAAAAAAGDVLRGESNGSTQTFYKNASQILQTTDTTFTTGLRSGVRAGIGGSGTNLLWDNFTGSDLSGPGGHPAGRRLGGVRFCQKIIGPKGLRVY